MSHETIYQTLFVQARGGLRHELWRCLRTGRATRRPQGRIRTRGAGQIREPVMISERPAEVEDRAAVATNTGSASTSGSGWSAGSAVAADVSAMQCRWRHRASPRWQHPAPRPPPVRETNWRRCPAGLWCQLVVPWSLAVGSLSRTESALHEDTAVTRQKVAKTKEKSGKQNSFDITHPPWVVLPPSKSGKRWWWCPIQPTAV